MGTSKGYQMPTGGAWTPLKTDGNRFVTEGPDGSVAPGEMVRRYLTAVGGARGILSGAAGSGGGRGGGGGSAGGQSGGGTGGGSTSAAGRVARGVGGFFSRAASAGLATALREAGLGALVGATAADLAAGLLDALAGPASTIDDAAARAALADLTEELLEQARTPEEVEAALVGSLDAADIAGLLTRFFGLYIYERFCRDFYERWVKAAGSGATATALGSIKEFIQSTLAAGMRGRDLRSVDWQGSEGAQVVSQVLSDTCYVFGVQQ